MICIETSHYVCFTRDPRDDIEGKGKWIFFDSMADRQCESATNIDVFTIMLMCTDDTYNIPRVTDCTRELNEWVYSDVSRDKLFSAQPRELPELVRRFTEDVYMCVYVQPDIAMYGDGVEEDYSVRESYSIVSESKCCEYTITIAFPVHVGVVPTVPKPMESKDDIVEELKQEITSLQAENRNLQQKIETNQAEQSQHIQLLEAEKQQLLQRYSEREHTTSQEMAEKEEQLQQLQRDLQTASKLAEEREMAVRRDLSARFTALVRELEGKTKELAAHNTEVWRIPANRVNIGSKIGKGGWGEVLEGTVMVAVKRLHEEIAYPIHIEKWREK